MTELLTAQRIQPIDWTGISYQIRSAFEGKVSAVCRSPQDCEDLARWLGDPDFCPLQPVLLLVPGAQPIAITGLGYATAAELRDCAVVTWHRTLEKAATGQMLDYDELRQRAGLATREKADELIREALWERAKRHKATPVTDPGRQPVYPNPTNRTVFAEQPGVPR